MYKDITHCIETCKDCASKKSPKRTATVLMQSIPIEGPFDRVCVDRKHCSQGHFLIHSIVTNTKQIQTVTYQQQVIIHCFVS